MIKLEGSEKQIAWAEQIKIELLEKIEKVIANPMNHKTFILDLGKRFELKCKGKEEIIKETSELLGKIKIGIENEVSAKRIISWKDEMHIFSPESVNFYKWL